MHSHQSFQQFFLVDGVLLSTDMSFLDEGIQHGELLNQVGLSIVYLVMGQKDEQRKQFRQALSHLKCVVFLNRCACALRSTTDVHMCSAVRAVLGRDRLCNSI